MKNIFLQLKLPFVLKKEGVEKIFENDDKNEKAQSIIQSFFEEDDYGHERCINFIQQLFVSTKIQESKQKLMQVKDKLLNILVYFISQQSEAEAFKNLQLILKSEESIFSKVKFFSNIFKSIKNQKIKKWLIVTSISLIESQTKISHYSSFVENFDHLISQLNFNGQEFVSTYLQFINYLEKHPIYKKLWSRYIIKCLLNIEKQQAKSSEVNTLFVKMLKESQINEDATVLLQKKQLKENIFYPFLQVLLLGDYQKFSVLEKQNLIKEKININDFERKVKIQAIPRILSGIKVAGYNQIAIILKIGKSQVEQYIIEAIQEGVLKAKIDEYKQCIIINNVKLRSLRPEQEANLQKDISVLVNRLEKLAS